MTRASGALMRVLLALAVLLGAALASEHSLRGPPSDRAWVFGYGSLINAESRAKAGVTGPAIPATVAGVRRQWAACVRNHHDGGYVAVALERGDAGDTVSGVIFSVPHSTLHRLDQRERGYIRVQIDWADVDFDADTVAARERPRAGEALYTFMGSALADAQKRCPDLPISQAYVDVVLGGLASLLPGYKGDAAMADFVRSTRGWTQSPFVNDRASPRCMFPLRDPRRGTRGDVAPTLTPELEARIDQALATVPAPELGGQNIGALRRN